MYCHRQCLRYPSNCPKDECKCVEKIDPKDPSIVLDRSSINIEKDFVTNYTNQNGHKVEEFELRSECYGVQNTMQRQQEHATLPTDPSMIRMYSIVGQAMSDASQAMSNAF